jgi:hypothetical protein
MNLLKFFRKNRTDSACTQKGQYAVIHRTLATGQEIIRQGLIENTSVKDRAFDCPATLLCTDFELGAYLYFILLQTMRKHNQAILVQDELDVQFRTLHKLSFEPLSEDVVSFLDSRLQQYIHNSKQKFGELKSRLNIIGSILYYQGTGRLWDSPSSFLDKLDADAIRALARAALLSYNTKLLEEETDEHVRTIVLLISDSVWYGARLLTFGLDNLFKSCVDLNQISEAEVIRLVQEGMNSCPTSE